MTVGVKSKEEQWVWLSFSLAHTLFGSRRRIREFGNVEELKKKKKKDDENSRDSVLRRQLLLPDN